METGLDAGDERRSASLVAVLAGAALGFAIVAAAVLLAVAFGEGVGLAAAALGAGAGAAAAARLARVRARSELARRVLVRLERGETERLDPVRALELGPLAAPLSRRIERASQLRSAAGRLGAALEPLPGAMARAEAEAAESHRTIEEAVEEAASLVAHMSGSIRGISGEVERLGRASEEASSSILEMGSAIDEVSRNATALHDAAGASASAVHQLSGSIRQVAESADAVQGMAEESAAAMVQMDRAIQEVSQHVSGASQLTEQVSAVAEDGSAAVAATIDGIDEIRRQTLEAKAVLERLAERIAEIDAIVDAIGGINEETHLLSLNAAIIAAQAGEQGKAFAVVANHVKTLAQRTAASTREIGALIGAVQQESANAVTAMGAGITAVETGVERSRRAGGALDEIRERAHQASARVAEIARASQEQSRNSKHVAEAAQNTSAMVQQISEAMSGQSEASVALLRNAESSLDVCRQVQHSIAEQRETARYITASISAINEMIKSIRANTESHSAASESAQEAVSRILACMGHGGQAAQGLTHQLEALCHEAARWAEAAGVEPLPPARD